MERMFYMKKATIADVADKAGVSKASVSRYIKQEKVRVEIAEKIQNAIEETGYIVKTPTKAEDDVKEKVNEIKELRNNQTAISHVNKKYKFSILTTDFTRMRTRLVIQALQKIWYEEGCLFQIYNTQGKCEMEENYITASIEQNVQAILIESCSNVEFIQKQLQTTSIPVVFLNDSKDGMHSLIFNEFKAGEILATYMMQKRHLIIRYIGVDENLCDARLKGIKDVYHGKLQPLDLDCKMTDGTFADIFEKIKEAFADKIDILLLENDEMAISLSKFIKNYHIAIPQNVSVVSFGGHEIVNVISPQLACVAYNYEEYARWVTDYIYALIEDKTIPKEPQMIEFKDGESAR